MSTNNNYGPDLMPEAYLNVEETGIMPYCFEIGMRERGREINLYI